MAKGAKAPAENGKAVSKAQANVQASLTQKADRVCCVFRSLTQPLPCMQEEVKEAKKVVREKKVFELPGQTKETPAEVTVC